MPQVRLPCWLGLLPTPEAQAAHWFWSQFAIECTKHQGNLGLPSCKNPAKLTIHWVFRLLDKKEVLLRLVASWVWRSAYHKFRNSLTIGGKWREGYIASLLQYESRKCAHISYQQTILDLLERLISSSFRTIGSLKFIPKLIKRNWHSFKECSRLNTMR